jgi:hypothetical protein
LIWLSYLHLIPNRMVKLAPRTGKRRASRLPIL